MRVASSPDAGKAPTGTSRVSRQRMAAGIEHAGSGGSNFSFTFGQCEAPQD